MYKYGVTYAVAEIPSTPILYPWLIIPYATITLKILSGINLIYKYILDIIYALCLDSRKSNNTIV